MLGYHTEAERHTSEGSIDLLVKTPRYIYVMELKVADRRPKKDSTYIIETDEGMTIIASEPCVGDGEDREEEDFTDEDDSAEVERVLQKAIRQIEERCYAEAFVTDGLKVIRMAIIFCAARHRFAKARIF